MPVLIGKTDLATDRQNAIYMQRATEHGEHSKSKIRRKVRFRKIKVTQVL